MPTRNSGSYRFPATLWSKPTFDDHTGKDNNPKLIRKLWINIIPKGATEPTQGDQKQSINRYELRTQWTPEEINSTMQIRTDKHKFEIVGVINVNEADEEWQIMSTKVSDAKA